MTTTALALALPTADVKATPKTIREFFGPDTRTGQLLPLLDLKELKETPGQRYATAYDDIAGGLGDGTLTY